MSRKQLTCVALGLTIAFGALAAVAAAIGPAGSLSAHTSLYDPVGDCFADNPASSAAWTGGAGLVDTPNRKGKAAQGLVLTKACSTSIDSSSDATIFPIAHVGALLGLGFAHKLDTACTGGSPGWDVETDTDVWRFACASGTHSTAGMPTGWEWITFAATDAQHLAGTTNFAFGSITPTFLQVLQDEQGSTTLDNLWVDSESGNVCLVKNGFNAAAACPQPGL
jgi:hypothetical protein